MVDKNVKALLMGLFCSALLSMGWAVVAQSSGEDAQASILPYQGHLDLDGAPYEGQIDVQAVLLNSEGEEWAESHEQVQVSQGRFGLSLGSGEAGLPDWFFETEDAFLRLEVRDASSDGEYTVLGGLQPMHATPTSYWTSQGNDFTVEGNLEMSGDLVVTGSTSANTAEMTPPTVTNLTLQQTQSGGLRLGEDETAGHLYYRANRGTLNLHSPDDIDHLGIVLGGNDAWVLADGKVTPSGDMIFADEASLTVSGAMNNVNRDVDNGLFLTHTEQNAGFVEGSNATENLGAATGHRFCYLKTVTIAIAHRSRCKVYESGGDFILEVSTDGPSHRCEATCVNW